MTPTLENFKFRRQPCSETIPQIQENVCILFSLFTSSLFFIPDIVRIFKIKIVPQQMLELLFHFTFEKNREQ